MQRDSSHLIHKLRIPAFFCALAVPFCLLLSHPFADMGMIDDAPYILVVKRLAETGHVVYNGWETAIFGWQFYLGAAFVKLFGYSFTTVRLSTVLLAMVIAFLLQRIMVRAGISERNACAGTLALVVSPLFLMISVTFMSDLPGLFAIVICLYGCLRALQATSERAAIFWMAFAVASNVICGSSRQIAWLGVLVMAPCTLWLLRKYRAVLVAGGAFTVAGWAALIMATGQAADSSLSGLSVSAASHRPPVSSRAPQGPSYHNCGDRCPDRGRCGPGLPSKPRAQLLPSGTGHRRSRGGPWYL
jgi:4-amino-4-deoxy-L-arabinose transferase-like glycosyltransferase